jgi:hypothetical protein
MMKDLDIYRWHYKEPQRQFGADIGMTYHCRSCTAIAHEGKLYDTFWMGHGGKMGGNYGPKFHDAKTVPLDKVELRYLGNLCDLEEIYPDEARDYEAGCVVDLRHSNNSRAPVLVPKGKAKSVSAMVAALESDIAELESTVRCAIYSIDRKKVEIARLSALVRRAGIEPAHTVCKTGALPLSYPRNGGNVTKE